MEEEEQGNDWLYTVIAEIIALHNMTIENVYTVINSRDQTRLSRLLPEQPNTVLPTEINDQNCLIGNFT